MGKKRNVSLIKKDYEDKKEMKHGGYKRIELTPFIETIQKNERRKWREGKRDQDQRSDEGSDNKIREERKAEIR